MNSGIFELNRLSMRWYKYLSPFVVFVLAYFAFTMKGWLTFLPAIYGFVFIPLLELWMRPDEKNFSAAEEEIAKKDTKYDLILYAIVPLQYFFLFLFLISFSQPEIGTLEIVGRIVSMGLLCGVFGINVAHELGHRVNAFEQFLAKSLLLTSQYIHFFIEHNKGHHKHVGTPEDPSSARLNESIFQFYPRTLVFSYLSAWKIANKEMQKKRLPALHFKNEMLQAQMIQLVFITLVFYFGGLQILLYYLGAAFVGILLLECVNYIEHYGLSRKKTESGNYERAMPIHSWNSNHPIGRLMLFELSRHSDHHYLASRKYQILRHYETAPQMPTGYPGMMVLAHFPPLWFRIMRKQINKYVGEEN
ncbi:MAG: alkane 1-monooxygenase [Bacteroidetes bacterium]|nr:alkane 1-monooxygenase [Bacteroidota bacterium]